MGGKLNHAVKESYTLSAKEIALVAQEQFTLKVGSATLQVKKNGDVVIKGAGYAIDVGLAMNEAVGGSKPNEVGGAYLEHVEGSRQESVAADKQVKVGRHFQAHVEGTITQTVGKNLIQDIKGSSRLQVKTDAACLARSLDLKTDTLSIIVNGKLMLKIEKSGKARFFEREARLDELASDPAQGGKATPKTRREAEVGLELEESGKLKPMIKRDSSGQAEFIDGMGSSGTSRHLIHASLRRKGASLCSETWVKSRPSWTKGRM